MKEILILPLVVLALFGMVSQQDISRLTGLPADLPVAPDNANATGAWTKFASLAEIRDYVKNTTPEYGGEVEHYLADGLALSKSATVNAPAASGGSMSETRDYSETNVQVAGVDEADIVKTDGDYIYVISQGDVYIAKAYPAKDAKIVSKIDLASMQPQEMFVSDGRLVVFGSSSFPYPEPLIEKAAKPVLERIMPSYYYPDSFGATKAIVYDISDKENPEKMKEFEIEGSYFDSRMIDGYVYFIVNQHFRYYNDDIVLPQVREDGVEGDVGKYTDVYYFRCCPERYYGYTSLVSISLDKPKIAMKTVLAGQSQTMYMSTENLYVAGQKTPAVIYEAAVAKRAAPQTYEERTVVHKVAVKDGSYEYVATGEVPGQVLNQFSMDEYGSYFRVATTTGDVWDKSSKNHVYVLDKDMEIAGRLEDLAPGEKIYSARFMGDRCYMVTYVKVDPLFVIDLKDPKDPKILGKLKIPGYSDYLHPYDENHLIGLGKEAVPAKEGDFSWYQGVKISLFDVTDVEHPKETAKYTIGDRGTDSEALQDHKAFLFDKKRNLLVIPILLAEIKGDREQPNEYGEYTFQGAYVFHIDVNDIDLRGRISHESRETMLKTGSYYQSENAVKRSLYIEDTLYTISENMIKANDLGDLKEISTVKLVSSAGFCGKSTYAACASDDDCSAGGCSGQVCQGTGEDIATTCEYRDCYDTNRYGVSCGCVEDRCQWV